MRMMFFKFILVVFFAGLSAPMSFADSQYVLLAQNQKFRDPSNIV